MEIITIPKKSEKQLPKRNLKTIYSMNTFISEKGTEYKISN